MATSQLASNSYASPTSSAAPGSTAPIGSGAGYYANSDWSGDQGIFNTSAANGAAVQNYISANNAAGQQSALAAQIGGQIGYYQGMQAPTMQGAQLGAAPTATAAQNNFNARGPYSQGASAGPAQLAGQVGINTGQSDQDRAMAMQNISALQQQASGQGPSLAAQQAQASSQAAIAGQMAAMGSQRGPANSSLGMRQAQLGAAANQQQTAQTAVQGRLQEQLNAQQQLGSNINNLQGQDIGLATNQAGLTQQTNLANSAAQNSMSLSNAQMAQSNSQYNAGLGLNYNQLNQSTAAQNAQLQQQAGLANQSMAGQYGLQQGAFNQATGQANLSSSLQQEGLNNQMVSGLYGQEGSLYGSAGMQQLEAAQGEEAAGLGQQSASLAQQQFGWGQGMQIAGLGMTAMSMSDENEKTDVEPVTADEAADKPEDEPADTSTPSEAPDMGSTSTSNVGSQLASADQSEEASAAATDQSIGAQSMATGDKIAHTQGSGGGGGGMGGGMMSMLGGLMSSEDEKTGIQTLQAGNQTIMNNAMAQNSSIGNAAMAQASSTSSQGSTVNPNSVEKRMKMLNSIGKPDNTGEGPRSLRMGSDSDIESDERAKKNISDDDYQTQSFLDALKAHSFRYKDPANGKGRFTGVMAQELEKTPIGKQAVIETPKGKMVDYARLASVMLAGQVLQNEQIKQLRMEIKDLKGMK